MGFIQNWFSRREEEKEIDKLENQLTQERKLLLKQRVSRLKSLREEEKLRQEEMDLEAELGEFGDQEDDEEIEQIPDSPEALLMGIINKALAGKGNSNTQTPIDPAVQNTLPASSKISDDELRELKKSIPKNYLKIAKHMNDNQLGDQIRKQVSNADDETIKRAIKIIRE